ncbi:MAG TPA: DinB family protein [Longimicrobiales bacterium]
MFRRVEDFTKAWGTEYEGTLKVFRALTDASLGQRVDGEGRTVGRLAWHITQSVPEMMNRTGLTLESADEHAPVPATAAAIVTAYEAAGKALLEQVGSWDDAALLEARDMYGEQWPNGLTLEILIRHQTHHRGQMTVLMRQAGLVVPGVYGPAREEWSAYGMAAQE